MSNTHLFKSNQILGLNTIAFTFSFAAWMLNGVLVTFLVDNQVFAWSSVQVGWLLGIPVLTGSIFRLPAGLLTDKFGGKPVFTSLLIICAIPMFLLSQVTGFWGYAFCSLGFGLAGTSFAVGIAYSSLWFPKEKQGLALGIFGAGNAGAAITSMIGPSLLLHLTNNRLELEAWRLMPMMYAGFLVIMAIIFFLLAENKKPQSSSKTLKGQLSPLKNTRVWRFGLYYFLVFGCFVAFAGWLVPYYTNVYGLDLATAGLLAACFSLPSGVIRAFGGWLSDRFGARTVMYWVLGSSLIISFALLLPKMDIYSAGKGIVAKQTGIVSKVSEQSIQIGDQTYPFANRSNELSQVDEEFHFWPVKETWQQPIVEVGDEVSKKELLAEGKTHIYFQANIWIFASLAILLGSIWGIGKAAVYKHIPDYFPEEVGVVGGMVGVLGGLGGFICPILFGYLLEMTGLWSSCWLVMILLSATCLIWMHRVIQNMADKKAPELSQKFDNLAA
ncbi:MFS transporter [Reichenbachiella ulvae]|uniref:MFS transporter n=1 Tax=Reichenbachiella ulvae TaxID=2980104 RepID=A0ABT3CX70_9BACT|nr:MFS transporter [Reichenbachiella ulvae]MCV9388171.1 MFS transporter [Reichenbachiella ulvae]